MSNQSDREGRIVVDGTVLGRAPILKKCDHCGGIADYVRVAEGYKAVCGKCGMQTTFYPWPEGAGEAWNARESEHARVITTQEILEFRADMTDDRGACACWLETIEGSIKAVMLEVSVSDEGREVYEHYIGPAKETGDYWTREEIDAEGVRWRLWDKRPKTADMEREPWGRVGYQVMSDAARAEAERIRAELDERQRERQRQRAEADSRQMEKLEEAAAQAGEL